MLPVHPAADLFPMMSDAELAELGADIKANGLTNERLAFFWDLNWFLLDGRNRLEAMERAGIDCTYQVHEDGPPSIIVDHPKYKRYKREGWPLPVAELVADEDDPYAHVLSANVHRRHLSPAQTREIVAKVIKAQPEKSDRAIAKQTGVSHPTVAKERAHLEQAGDVETVSTRTDTKGRKQPATRKRPARPTAKPKAKTAGVAGAKAPSGQPAGSSFANWVRTATDDVGRIAGWLEKVRPSDMDADGVVALEALAGAGHELSVAAGELAVKNEREDR